MSANFVKRHCAIGWEWYFETDGYSSPVSNVVKGYIESIEAENAKLREQVADACMQLGGAWARCAELRELARFIMHQCNDGNPRCDECIGWNDGECVALLRMRELGVEP